MDDEGRYRLALTRASGRGMRGWWADEVVARRQFLRWVGERGREGSRITLTDTLDWTVIHRWPDEE